MDDQTTRCFVVCTDETGRYDASVEKALQRASDDGAKVILYNVTAPGSAFSTPRPNEWAGEGAQEEFERPLDPVALEKLGRHEFALQVQAARKRGIDAWGWLPDKFGGDALAGYATQQGADLVMLPADLDEPEITQYFDLDETSAGLTVERV